MAYFVSAIDGTRTAIVAGPFNTHGAALAQVEKVRKIFTDDNPKAHFVAFGTCRHKTARHGVIPARLAKVNDLIGYELDERP